ncbi:SRPBCC family protein [Hoyosella rhizosphaerae]|uniref:Polyketide cyclase n=1 Tax=Hoyosella rhizosphaerae TaxID=1755582 RepID=A0A916U898_9ACTN|nr:SRPBCC family protein [Hoyosella rhizosphaerae]MBN4927464.1 SRPBCC family protein [Hoyosella rhizosphaerae]GGC64223.1 polyketide cyclase [Hoyosella rhizosphaerae]
MRPIFNLTEVDLEFFDSAPHRYSFSAEIPVDIDEMWSELGGEAPLSWCKLVKSAQYITERPFGLGTRRRLTLMPGLATVEERYFLWNEKPGERYENAFSVVKSSAPGLKRFGEYTLLEKTPTGTRFTWKFAIEGQLLLKPGLLVAGPVLGLAFKSLMNDTEEHFSR